MISPAEFQRISSTKEYATARGILKMHGADFSSYNLTQETVDKLVSGEYDEAFMKAMKKSYDESIDIDVILIQSVDKVSEFFSAFEDENTKERLFLLIGETGVGKTYEITSRYPNIIKYACDKSIDSYSLMWFLADTDGTGLKPHATPFQKAIVEGHAVYMDEINLLPFETLMLLQGLTDEKEDMVVGDKVVTIHKNFRILGTMNPPSATDERTPLGDALLGRAVGLVMKLTDDMIISRLDTTQEFLDSVRSLHRFCKMSGSLTDVRELSFRDYQRFLKYDFETQFEFKMAVGETSNVQAFANIQSTGEYQKKLKEVYNAIRRRTV